MVLVAAGVAGFLVLAATARGPGLGPDSLKYILLARSLAEGRGFTLAGEPVTHFPPGYPVLLRLAGISGPESLGCARYLQAAFFAINVLLAAWVARTASSGAPEVNSGAPPCSRSLGDRGAGTPEVNSGAPFCSRSLGHRGVGARWAAPVAALVLVGSPPMTTVHAMVWSEVPFVALVLVALLLLAAHVSGGGRGTLVAGAGCLALAILTRYVGLAFVAVAVAAPLLRREERWRASLANAIGAGVVAVGPAAAWLVRNALATGSVANRTTAYHPLGLGHLAQLRTSSAAFWGYAGEAGGLVTLGAFLWGFALFARRLGQPRRRGSSCATAEALLALTAFAGACYAAFLAVSLAFADADTPLDVRVLAPLHVLGAVLIAALPAVWLSRSPRVACTVWAALATLGVANLSRSVSEAERLGSGAGFSHPYWQRSATLDFARWLDPGVRLYSNGPEIVAFFTGREVWDVPAQASRTSLEPDPGYAQRLDAFCAGLATPGTALVHLDGVGWRWELPTIEEIESTCRLTPLARFDDGSVYGAPRVVQ